MSSTTALPPLEGINTSSAVVAHKLFERTIMVGDMVRLATVPGEIVIKIEVNLLPLFMTVTDDFPSTNRLLLLVVLPLLKIAATLVIDVHTGMKNVGEEIEEEEFINRLAKPDVVVFSSLDDVKTW